MNDEQQQQQQQNKRRNIKRITASKESFAIALNQSIYDIEYTKQKYENSLQTLYQNLQNNTYTGIEKHQLLCQHRINYGQHPFVCNKCWSYIPICICNNNDNNKISSTVPVILWTHHKEWGSTTNTGSVLAANLVPDGNCRMLMKGLYEHDQELQNILNNNDNVIPIVLWTTKTSSSSESTTGEKSSNKGRGGNARRMVTKLPIISSKQVVRVWELSENDIYNWRRQDQQQQQQQKSLLQPLRKQKKLQGIHCNRINSKKVCTAEAIISALVALQSISILQGQQLLNLVEEKVKNTLAYQGKSFS